jgi:succinyl-CoA synthetase beta subunit
MGGKVANFLDVGGGASAEKVQSALELTFKQPHVKMVFVNIFGGITRCDHVAEGILAAFNKFPNHVPIVVRLIGTNDLQGIQILANHGIKAFTLLEPALEETILQRKLLDGGIPQ